MINRCQELTKSLSKYNLIAGSLAKSNAKQMLDVMNPSTMEIIGYIPASYDDEIDLAVNGAAVAQKTWAAVKASERGKLVKACGMIIKDHAEELAALMSFETGKAIRTESKVEVSAIEDIMSFYGGLALELKGETIPYDPNMLTMTLREPIGVVGAIIPWNVPLMLMAMKIAPALVAGNTVVLKPSPEATFCVLRAAELMNRILPAGVLNVICGGKETGAALVANPKVAKVTFTGSVEAGRSVYTNAAKKLIPVTLELGGKSPFIICEDANVDLAVASAVEGMRFTRQGQSCSAASRLFVHESIHDLFVEKMQSKLKQMVMGDPMDEATDIGTIISKRQYAKIQSFIDIANNDSNLTLHHGCELPAGLKSGLFIRPILITGLKNYHKICQNEIFGPVAAIIKWHDFDDVIAAANNTEFGLAAGIWTKDLSRALQAAHRLNAGFVQVNQYIVFRPSLPFGGFKNSGLGKEASLGSMLEHYTKQKTVIINMKS